MGWNISSLLAADTYRTSVRATTAPERKYITDDMIPFWDVPKVVSHSYTYIYI